MFSSFEELEAWKEFRKLRQMISNLIKSFPELLNAFKLRHMKKRSLYIIRDEHASLAAMLHAMTQLVERQADDDEMAYKLMVLFPQLDEFSDHAECLNAISGKFNSISKPVKAQKPYHRVFVTELGNFPSFETQEKINAWRAFIVKEKFDALAFFADCNSFESVPETIKAAKSTQLNTDFHRPFKPNNLPLTKFEHL